MVKALNMKKLLGLTSFLMLVFTTCVFAQDRFNNYGLRYLPSSTHWVDSSYSGLFFDGNHVIVKARGETLFLEEGRWDLPFTLVHDFPPDNFPALADTVDLFVEYKTGENLNEFIGGITAQDSNHVVWFFAIQIELHAGVQKLTILVKEALERLGAEDMTNIGRLYIKFIGIADGPKMVSFDVALIKVTGSNGVTYYDSADFIAEVGPDNSIDFSLGQNYPNPFNPITRIKFTIPKSGNVNLAVYNLLGQEVAILINEEKQTGSYEVEFNASNLPSGFYVYRIQSGDFVQTKKMMLVK